MRTLSFSGMRRWQGPQLCVYARVEGMHMPPVAPAASGALLLGVLPYAQLHTAVAAAARETNGCCCPCPGVCWPRLPSWRVASNLWGTWLQ